MRRMRDKKLWEARRAAQSVEPMTVVTVTIAGVGLFAPNGIFTSTPQRPRIHSSCGICPEFLESLLEQDSVSNLRYGVLFLLALSSLGVYSIILAG